MHVQGAGRGRFPECLVNVDTRAWFTLTSTGGVDDDADDDATTLTQGLSPSLLRAQSDAWKNQLITALFQCLSFCQMRILRITSYLIVSIRFHS